MARRPVDPNAFWDAKILTWDRERYAAAEEGDSLVTRLRRRMGSSVRSRMTVACELLAPVVQGKRVTELGCGAGRLALPLLEAGAASYVGFDFSSAAVEHARAEAERLGIGARATFDGFDVRELSRLDADIVVSLGLLDWLDDDSVARVFAASESNAFLHSFSERRASLSQGVHRLYVHLAYGHRTGSYVPAYHSEAQLRALAARSGHRELRFVRDSRLSFGAFVSSLPVAPSATP